MKKAWIISGIVLVAAGAGVAALYYSHTWPFSTPEVAATTQHEEAPPAEEGTPVAGHVKLTEEQIKNAQIQADAIAAKSFAPQMQLVGTIQEDPDATFIVRAQAAGILRGGNAPWPRFGQMLKGSTTIGTVEQRLVPSDQISLAAQRATLQTQVASAQAEVTGATASLEAAKVAYQRLKSLNAQDKNVSDRVVEEALVKMQTEEARLAGAKQSFDLAAKALQGLDVQLSGLPLMVSEDGQVAEVSAHPGEAVEPGQQIVRLIDPHRLVAALHFSEPVPADVRTSHIFLPGRKEAIDAEIIPGATATVDPRTRQQVVLFHLPIPPASQPPAVGTPISASIDLAGQPLQGFVLPQSAIVRYQGKAWVYLVAKEEHAFDRVEVSTDHLLPDGSGWFVNQGFKGEEHVVTSGAAVLLSHELIVLGG